MISALTSARWMRSRACSTDGCVEVAYVAGGLVAVRDSKDLANPPHVVGRDQWQAFLAGVRDGDFDI